MFFRDPSGNVVELLCVEGLKGADKLPVGKAAGHGEAFDVNELPYTNWKRPRKKGSRVIVRDH